MKLKLLVLDVLKPIESSIVELTEALSKLKGVKGVSISVVDINRHTENVKVAVYGNDFDFESVKKVIEDFGASIHSIDTISSGEIPIVIWDENLVVLEEEDEGK